MCRPQRQIGETAEMLVANNFTLFFDIDSDGNHSRYLHSVVLFSELPHSSEYVANMMNGAPPLHACMRPPFVWPIRPPRMHSQHASADAVGIADPPGIHGP